MTSMQQWMAVFIRPAQGARTRPGAGQGWQTPRPSHPAPPAWMVPAYQRRRLSGDRVTVR